MKTSTPPADVSVDSRDLRNLAVFLFANPAREMSPLFDTATAFCSANVDMVHGCKLAGVSMKSLSTRLTECKLPISRVGLSRVLRALEPRVNRSRVAVFACEVGRASFDAGASVSHSLVPAARVADPIPTLETSGRPASTAPAPSRRDLAVASTQLGLPLERPKAPPTPLTPTAATSTGSVAVVERMLRPIAGEDEDFCSENTKSKMPIAYGEFRRRAWEDSVCAAPLGYAVFDNGERIYVSAKLRSSLFEGRLETWSDFNKKLDAM